MTSTVVFPEWRGRMMDLFEFVNSEKPSSIPSGISVIEDVDCRAIPIATLALGLQDVVGLLRSLGLIVDIEGGIIINQPTEEQIKCFPLSFEIAEKYFGTPDEFPYQECQDAISALLVELDSMLAQQKNGRVGFRLHYKETGLVCKDKHRGDFTVIYSDGGGTITLTTLKSFKERFPGRPYGICPVIPCQTED